MANANGAAQANGSRVGPSWLFRASRLHGPTIGGRARVPRPQQSTVLSFCRSVAHPVLLRGRSAEPRPLRMPSARGAARAALICCCSCVFADACPPLIRPQSASSHRGASQCVAGCDGGTGHAARCTGPDRVATFTRLLRPPPHFTLCCWDLGTLGPLAPAVWTGLAATRISHPAPGHASACTGHAMFSGAHDVGRRATSGCRRPGSGCSLGAPPRSPSDGTRHPYRRHSWCARPSGPRSRPTLTPHTHAPRPRPSDKLHHAQPPRRLRRARPPI
ncbi:hypothetical protein AcW1_009308 [Taiwanofungus camphoratus]|nr:hypothetical protein AcW1_009308 [Antrodia cinnamomea]